MARRLLFTAVMACLSACTPDISDLAPRTTGQEEISGRLLSEGPILLLLVVDDADTNEAAELRGRIVDSVREGLLHIVSERWGSCGSDDPAQWHPGDIRVAIARPSAPDDLALLTPVKEPSLAWVTKTSLEEEVEAVVSATTRALQERLAQPGEVFRPLHAAKRAAELLAGTRPPATDEEAAFMGSLPADETVWLVVASTRDDADPAPLKDNFLDEKTSDAIYTTSLVGPFTPTSDELCEWAKPGGTRLGAWGEKEDAQLGTWPCDHEHFWEWLLFHWFAHCGPLCHDRPVVTDAGGKVACRFFVDQPDLAGCDAERGWVDPDGEPQIIEEDGQKVRRCEIVQLTGDKLEACQSTLECSGCGGGFCLTDVPELDESERCERGLYWPLRFVGGALEPGTFMTGTCWTG